MSRKITPQERNILLEHPELVMFDPYSALRTHRCSLGQALILPAVTGVIFFLWGFLCPGFINAHPRLFAGAGCAALIIASGTLPVLYMLLDDRRFRKAREDHYAEQLKLLLPQDLECSTARVQWITYEKAEGGWILEGREELFGYASCVNFFRIEPDTDLAVISDGVKFRAFVKRDTNTESFYQETENRPLSPRR